MVELLLNLESYSTTRLSKIQISKRKSPLSEVNFSPSCRNSLENIIIDTMADSPVFFTIITNIISSDLGQSDIIAMESIKIYASPNIF